MKIVFRFAIFFLVLFGTFFIMEQPSNLSAKHSSLPAQANNKVQTDKRPLYHFGTPPYQKGQAIDEIRTLYKPMLTWLGDQAGCRFDFIGADTYDEMIKMVAEGKVQLAALGPVPYLLAKQQNPKIKLLLTELKWDEEKKHLIDTYRGYILTLKKREDLKTLWDLKGKKFAFVNRHSTSGYKYPNALMKQKGINPNIFFSKIYFLGSHPRVTDALVAGSIDAGSTWGYNWSQAVRKHGDIFKPIFRTPPIPHQAIVAHPSLPDHISHKIQKVLPAIDPSLLKGLQNAGFAIRPDSFYDGMRLLLEGKK